MLKQAYLVTIYSQRSVPIHGSAKFVKIDRVFIIFFWILEASLSLYRSRFLRISFQIAALSNFYKIAHCCTGRFSRRFSTLGFNFSTAPSSSFEICGLSGNLSKAAPPLGRRDPQADPQDPLPFVHGKGGPIFLRPAGPRGRILLRRWVNLRRSICTAQFRKTAY